MDEFVSQTKAFLKDLPEYISFHRVRVGVVSVFCIFLLLFGVYGVPGIRNKIRTQEVAATFRSEFTFPEKTILLPYGQVSDITGKNDTCVIIFVKARSSAYDTVKTIVNNKTNANQLTRPIYIYPLIYQNDPIINKLKLDLNGEAICFEKGKRTTQVKFSDLGSLADDFIGSVNALSMDYSKEIE